MSEPYLKPPGRELTPREALNRLYSIALFSPGVAGATFANVLLRAERALAGVSLSDERSLPLELAALRAELAALRDNIEQRQNVLQRVHDALRKANGG